MFSGCAEMQQSYIRKMLHSSDAPGTHCKGMTTAAAASCVAGRRGRNGVAVHTRSPRSSDGGAACYRDPFVLH